MTDTAHRVALDDLRAAVQLLPSRRAYVAALAERRDLHARCGQHAVAAVWQALAVLIAEIEDTERDVLRGLDFVPGITGRPLTEDELADDVDTP